MTSDLTRGKKNERSGITPAIAGSTDDLASGKHGSLAAIGPRPCGTSAPLTLAQQRMWLVNQLQPASPLYNRARASRWSGPLDATAVERSLAELVQRHDILRT